MRTLPANFTTGLTNHYRIVWLVKLIGDSATYYWLTNKRGNTATSDVTLTDNSATKSYDSSLLAKSINGSDEVAIGEIEQNIDISGGGAVGSCCDVDLILLNQLRFDTTLESFGLENRTVSIYCGFIPDGTIPTLELTDMIPIWTGVFDSHEEDYGQETIHLVDSRDLRHKSIPQTIINNTSTSGVAANFPNAPDESVGQVLPILYGDFIIADSDPDEANDRAYFYEKYSIVPSVCIDKANYIFCIAGHVTHTASYTMYFEGDMKVPAYLYVCDGTSTRVPITNNVNSSGISTISIPTGQVIGQVYQLFSSASSRNNITDFFNAIDGNPATYATIPNTTGTMLELCVDGLASGALLINLNFHPNLYFIVDAIVSDQSYLCGQLIAGSGEENQVAYHNYQIQFKPLYITYSSDFLKAAHNVSDLANYTYYIQDNSAYTPTLENAKVYAMGLNYTFIISANIVKPYGEIFVTGTGTRGAR